MSRRAMRLPVWGVLIVAAIVWLIQSGHLPWTFEASPPAAPPSSFNRGSGYERHPGCKLVASRQNDGDSFLVRLPDGRERIFRLYYVDAPESAFRRYRNGETNAARIRQQAQRLGNITPQQAVEVGTAAKEFTLDLLARKPFTIHTAWDSPFNDGRYHAFLEVDWRGERRWLHELLVHQGLARIHTKPAPLPDGTSVSRQQRRLRELEKQAQRDRLGAWSY